MRSGLAYAPLSLEETLPSGSLQLLLLPPFFSNNLILVLQLKQHFSGELSPALPWHHLSRATQPLPLEPRGQGPVLPRAELCSLRCSASVRATYAFISPALGLRQSPLHVPQSIVKHQLGLSHACLRAGALLQRSQFSFCLFNYITMQLRSSCKDFPRTIRLLKHSRLMFFTPFLRAIGSTYS